VSVPLGRGPTRRESVEPRVPMPEADLEAFYRQVFMPLVRRAAWKHGLSKEDAADVVQDAFVLALGKLDTSRNPKAWLIQVVDLMALNLQRKAGRRARLALRWGTGLSARRRSDGYERGSGDTEVQD
jgi:DNA-directed RNA polymerase specialized sigma24 family protein